jgi:glycosyltransferase involved in cell wall biosynthesis
MDSPDLTEPEPSALTRSGLSVVIPAFNAQDWIGPTVTRIRDAFEKAQLDRAEIIVVDDGSSDGTLAAAERLAALHPRITVMSHPNAGRFITRREGVKAACYGRILFIDTRVWIDPGAIAFLDDQLTGHAERTIWNGHINVSKAGNIIARFGDAITSIGWRRYFRAPRLVSYGVADFDHYPKGTGLFSAETARILEAMAWFETVTHDLRNSSDDTLLIRHFAESERIWLSPDFSGTYFARSTFGQFVRHSYQRGRFFVDGFLRPGNRFFLPLIAFLVATPLLVVALIWQPLLWVGVGAVWLAGLMAALALRIDPRDALALWALSPVFALSYGAGIWRAVIHRALSR